MAGQNPDDVPDDLILVSRADYETLVAAIKSPPKPSLSLIRLLRSRSFWRGFLDGFSGAGWRC